MSDNGVATTPKKKRPYVRKADSKTTASALQTVMDAVREAKKLGGVQAAIDRLKGFQEVQKDAEPFGGVDGWLQLLEWVQSQKETV